MSAFSRLASALRSLPAWAARYLDNRITALEDSVSGLAADGGPYTCLAGDTVGMPVYLSAADTIAQADADNAAKIPAIGIISSKDSDTQANVRFCGIVPDAGAFTAGAIQYLSTTAGALTETPPAAPAATPVGIAINTTDLLVLPLGVLSYMLRSTTNKLGAAVVSIEDALTLITATTVEGALAELAQFKADLGSVTAGKGGSLVAYEDSGSKTTAATLDAALDEIYLDRLTTSRAIPIPLGMWREVSATGDVGNIAAIGGHLASDSAPILRADANNDWEIFWATTEVDPIGVQLDLPPDFDGTGDAIFSADIASGATDAATLSVRTSWNGGAEITDSADDSGTKSAVVHTITATILAADIDNSARRVTIRVVPPAHGSDGITLKNTRLRYTPKLLT
jgi:hypothetical protein